MSSRKHAHRPHGDRNGPPPAPAARHPRGDEGHTQTSAPSTPVAPPPAQAPSGNDMLGATFLFSLVLHGVLILGVGFAIAKPEPSLPTLDVTVVNTANGEAPEHADFLAQANNSGGGDSDQPRRPSAPVSGLLPTAQNGLAPRPLRASSPQPSQASGPPHVVSRSDSRFEVDNDPRHRDTPPNDLPQSDTDIRRQQEMAKLASEIRAETEAYAKRPHRKFISANTREYAFAAYMRAWATRVERVGTLNFPDAANGGDQSGNLILTVGLRRDGSIMSIDVIESSGRTRLDQAAERIVRLAAPFPPIPRTSEKVDELYITRTYEFTRGGVLQTQ